MNSSGNKVERVAADIVRASTGLAKVIGIALLVYLTGMAIFAITRFSSTKSTLLSYGLSDSTSSLLAWSVMFIAIGIPGLAVARLIFFRGRSLDYAAAMILPLVSWGMAQIPANFNAVTGQALRYCALRPDNTLFCLDHPGIDPLNQKRLVAMTPNMAELQFRKDKGLAPKKIALPVAEIAFFDSLTAEPKVWVSSNAQGCYDLFDNPGVSIDSGEQLVPVTKEIVRVVRKCGNLSDRRSDAPKAQATSEEDREAKSRFISERRVNNVLTQYQPVKVQLSDKPSNPVRIIGGKCIYFWQETPGSHHSEVISPGKSMNDWVTLAEHNRQGGGEVEWIRWTGGGQLGYELRPDGHCK